MLIAMDLRTHCLIAPKYHILTFNVITTTTMESMSTAMFACVVMMVSFMILFDKNDVKN